MQVLVQFISKYALVKKRKARIKNIGLLVCTRKFEVYLLIKIVLLGKKKLLQSWVPINVDCMDVMG